VRALLVVRDNLVRTRIRQVQVLRALTRREGLRVRSGKTTTFEARLRELELPEWLQGIVAPVVVAMDEVNRQLAVVDRGLVEVAGRDPVVQRLDTVPGVGPVTAIAYVATLDQVERFAGPHQVECYLGLVPREWSSGEQQRKGRITKAGSSRVRWLLVEAAWSILRSRKAHSQVLREWAERIAVRRGRRTAVVAMARRLAGILYAMWRDGTEYDPSLRPRRRIEPVAPERAGA
jgi:transposase